MKNYFKGKTGQHPSTLGGQAGLNLGMELAESGFLEEHGVKLIGTTAETIFKAEDRQAFKDTMEKSVSLVQLPRL